MSEAAEGPCQAGALTMKSVNRARRTQRLWTQDEEERLAYLREVEGLSASHIAQMLGRTPQSVSAKMAGMGLMLPGDWRHRRGWGPSLPARAEEQARRFWMQGMEIEAAAERLGLYEARVARAYRRFSEEERARAILPPQIGTYIGAKEMTVIAAPLCGVKPAGILGPSRLKPFVCARMAVARALRDRGISFSRIAGALGRTDHSTAFHWVRQFDAHCRAYPETRRAYEAIKRAEEMVAERRAA